MNICKSILYFPLSRILLSATLVIVANNLFSSILTNLFHNTSLGEIFYYLIVNLFPAILLLIFYYSLIKFYEKREVEELRIRSLGKSFSTGFFIGALLQFSVILIIYLNSSYLVQEFRSVKFIFISALIALPTAVFEEILFRGILYRIMEEKLGTIVALISSSLIFGFMHILNPGSSIFSSLAISIEAGFLLGMAYVYTRNLWFPIGIHYAWNFFQSGIFGVPTSGSVSNKSFIIANINGSELLTGGSFGPEASVQAVVLCAIVASILMFKSSKQAKFISPFWKKN